MIKTHAQVAKGKKQAAKPAAKQRARKTKTTAPETNNQPEPEKDKPTRGRPTIYTQELANKLCTLMGSGKSLRKACEEITLAGTDICESTVRQWVIDDYNGFYAQYTRAIQVRALRWAEEIVEISDDGSNDTYIDPDTGQERTNHEIVARSRLRTDTRKWMLSKVLPKVYGDKLDLNHGVQPENPLATLLQRIAGTGLPAVKDPKK